MTEPTVFGPQATEQIVKTVREVSRRMMNETPNRARWQHQPGGAVVTRVRFEIVSSDPTTLTGLGTILSWNYGFTQSQIPASILGNTVIELCDPKGCMLNEPNVDLTGRQGDAEYRQGLPDAICRNGYEPFPGVWEVTGLCCRLIACEVII